jgi:hypothetical protein
MPVTCTLAYLAILQLLVLVKCPLWMPTCLLSIRLCLIRAKKITEHLQVSKLSQDIAGREYELTRSRVTSPEANRQRAKKITVACNFCRCRMPVNSLHDILLFLMFHAYSTQTKM